MKKYQKQKGYKTFAGMMRTAFRILTILDPADLEEGVSLSLPEQLKKIDDKLTILMNELDVIKKDEEILEKRLEINSQQKKELEYQLNEINIENIPYFNEIKFNLLDLLENITGKSLKEFVIMEYLRKDFEEKYIWLTIMKLRQLNIIIFEKGEVKLNEE